MIKQMLNAILPFVLPVLFGFGIYLTNYVSSSSYQVTKSRMRRYSIILFAICFVSLSALMSLMILATCYRVIACEENIDVVAILEYIPLLIYVALLALIPALLLYVVLHIFHRFYAKYDKPKRKLKNDQKASLT